MWVLGKPTIEEFMAWAPSMDFNGVVEKITVPFLVTQGADNGTISRDFIADWVAETFAAMR